MAQPTLGALRRGILSPATVIAAAALFVALGGTGYAALRGPGTPASAASAGVALDYVHAGTPLTLAADTVEGATLTCPIGSVPVGGGDGTDSVAGVVLLDTLPYDSAAGSYLKAATAWTVWVQNTTSGAQTLRPYVVCASGVSSTSAGVASARVLGSYRVAP